MIVHAWNHSYTINAVSSFGVARTLERMLFLDLGILVVTEIS